MIIKRLLLFSTLLTATLLTAGCSGRITLGSQQAQRAAEGVVAPERVPMPDDKPSLADGKQVYEKMKCAECHGPDGGGVRATAPGLLSDPKRAAGDRAPIFQFGLLYYGFPGWFHPVLKNQLSNREVWDLVFYVRSFASPPLKAEELARAKQIYGSNCSDCHGEDGYGDGQLSHNLNPLPANFHQSDRFLDRQDSMLWSHIGKGLYPTAMPSFLGRKDKTLNVVFDNETIDMMVSYIRHFEMQLEPTDLSRDEKSPLPAAK